MKFMINLVAGLMLCFVVIGAFADEAPRMSASDSAIDFGGVAVGESQQRGLLLTNDSVDTVQITDVYIAKSGGAFSLSDCPAILITNTSCHIYVSFAPGGEGVQINNVIVEFQKYNATPEENPEGDTINVKLTGEGV